MPAMRKGPLTLLFTFFMMLAFGQPTPFDQKFVDSMRMHLPAAPDDTTKVYHLALLASMHLLTNPALTIQYGNEGVALAARIHFPKGMIACLGQTAFCYATTGEWAKAVRDVNKALPLSEKYYPQALSYLYIILFNVADARGNYAEALQWAAKGFHLPTTASLPEVQRWPPYFALARGYERVNRLDSADYLSRKVLQFAKKYATLIPDLTNNSYILCGDIAAKRNNFPDALQYYRLASYAGGLASVYHRLHQSDSAKFYALHALQEGWFRNVPHFVQGASLILAQEYASTDPRKANQYLRIYIASRDSLYSSEKLKQLEEIQLKEQQNHFALEQRRIQDRNRFTQLALLAGLVMLLGFSLVLWRTDRFRKKANEQLEEAYHELKATQQQLIQREKMASLGELTAGIAHEIQNPLNFVNNFSETNTELTEDLLVELDSGNIAEAKQLAIDIKQNEEKISHHGKRADRIVKNMLQHSRADSGEKQSTNLNALIDEYLHLAYHGYQSKDKSFNAALETSFDGMIGQINLVPQDFGRVLMNLFNNAFYAVAEKKKQLKGTYEPVVSISTKMDRGHILISVHDNGTGMSEKVSEKVFQPFFTTKPTGEGTGLGLSLSYDIVTKGHGGSLNVSSKEGEGAEFVVELPASKLR